MMRTALITILGCVLMAAPAAGQWWCYEGDRILAEVEGSTITVHHLAAFYNCCPDRFDYTVGLQGTVIDVTEDEVLTVPCTCLCCYNLMTEIEDVPPGEYTLNFHWYDYEHHQWETWPVLVIVPDVGQGGDPTIGSVLASDCLENAALPDPGVEPQTRSSTWGAIKATFE